ncbi:chitin disaccharide deacetylase [Peribacillus kribbensis]|uniref:chitin disaccharide deacetylase n=1 Tax=Peribacillus kribbensis TaxID=356658 RepID=UPI0004295D1C|nr:chitin disaccharide deacetylase [Peribacillus kribbensis]
MVKVVINADDFGYSKGVNLGIIEAYQNGIVTSATLMANMPGAAHAAALALENPGLGVGVHLVLDCGSPVCDNVHSLMDERGTFLKASEIVSSGNPEEIERELSAQIEKVISFGIKPTHFDSHHHIHGYEKTFGIVSRLAAKYAIPYRPVAEDLLEGSDPVHPGVQYFSPDFYGDDLSSDRLKEVLEKTRSYETAEIMTHPAYLDEGILSGSSYNVQRVRELSILTREDWKPYLGAKNIELVTYAYIGGQAYA